MSEKIDHRPKALQIIKMRGPVIPRDLVRALGGDTFIMGAVLSQLVNAGQVKVTNVKIGGTCFYYVPGQEAQLVKLKDHLNQKDMRTFSLIEREKVVKDEEQDPLVRVSLRAIKDYAKPLEVNIGDKKTLYWKWFLTSKEEATEIIKKSLGVDQPKQEEKPEPKKEKEKSKEIEKKEEKIEQKPTPQPKPEVKQEAQTQKPETTHQEKLAEEESEQKEIEKHPGEFFDSVYSFFKKNNIEILDQIIVRKAKEIDFTVKVPTSVGNTTFYCKAKSKKRISDADLSTAIVKSQSKNLPPLFISDGVLSKKAEKTLGTELKITFKQIE